MEPGVFANLVEGNQIPKLVAGISAAVSKSFDVDQQPGHLILVTGVRRVTKEETDRRVKICVGIFKVLRGDLKWSLDRIVDHLPKYLRAELDGTSWEPSARAGLWTTG